MFNQLHGKSSEWIWNRTFGYKPRTVRSVGFKIFYYHPLDAEDNWVWDRIYNDTSIPIIHLTRTNLLRTYLSRQIADKTRVWRDETGNKAIDTDDKRVTLDPNECKAEFIKTDKWVKEAESRMVGHRVLQVTYEELTGEGQGACLNRIQEFLQVKPLKLSSGMKRQNAEDIEKLVLNYEELARSLKGTEWERFL
jgi:LPS sulfotransferase NodH